MQQAKKAGKLRDDYQIPAQFRDNYPEVIINKLAPFISKGVFQRFPFGTDFTEKEQVVGKALKSLKRKSYSKKLMFKMLLKAMFTLTIPEVQRPYLESMGLWSAKSIEEKLYRNLLSNELKNTMSTE
jgi:hypothetical protein